MTANSKTLVRFAGLDVALVALACLVPTASHLFNLPLYMANPMLALLLAGMLLGRDWRNSLLLAVLMPLASSLLVGMPVAPKMLCMMAELAVIVAAFRLLSTHWQVLPAVLVAALVGKVVYYALKALVLTPAVLVGSHWAVQLLAVLLWGGLFALLYSRRK